jgi:hypothetical protein
VAALAVVEAVLLLWALGLGVGLTGWLGLWWAFRPALRQAPLLLLPLDLCGPRLWSCLLKWRCVCARACSSLRLALE